MRNNEKVSDAKHCKTLQTLQNKFGVSVLNQSGS